MKTIIQQEMERQKAIANSSISSVHQSFGATYTITVLESLLEPEKRQIENSFTDGAICMDQLKNHEYPNYQHGEGYYKNKYEAE